MLKAIKLFLLDRTGRKEMEKFVWFCYWNWRFLCTL